jgi:hypothetical protein|tara:strand:- start:319 stop:525 length:207 start_codon:yes stop_codon:yes gene_type:complete
MKTTKMFKMDLDNGEAEFIQSPEFYWEDPLLKLDILKDWIDDLTIVYNKTIPKFEKQLERRAKVNKQT